MSYDIKAIEQLLQQQQEIIPDKHDGSYELVQETVRSYSRMNSFSELNYLDLNLVYLMTVGTWRHSVDRKKETIEKSNLPDVEKVKLTSLLNNVWAKAKNHEYENIEPSQKDGSLGMFGTGFYTFQHKTTDQSVRDFIKMCVDIIDVEDTEQIFEIVEQVLSKEIKGMRSASASMILHCLKPTVFPILNGNFGVNNIYENLGLKLKKVLDTSSYIKNCRIIKTYRDKNYSFKNYRVFDVVSLQIDDYKIPEKYAINKSALAREIAAYKKEFSRIKKEETYKWQAIKTFQDNFDLDEKDLLGMLKRALKSHGNLLNTGSYFMADICLYDMAEHFPEDTRTMLKNLFNEDLPVINRIDQFIEDTKIYFNIFEEGKKPKNNYQDERAATVYLFFMYPDKYSIYRSEKFTTVANVLEYANLPKKRGERVQAYFDLVDLVWEELKKDSELLELSKTRLTESCYDDPAFHVLAEDLMWFIYTTHREKAEEVSAEFYPSLEEFNPNLSKDQYEKAFTDLGKNTIDILYYLYKMGGVGSCKQVSNRYGNTAQHYNANAIVIAKRICQEYNIQTLKDDEGSNEKYWPVLFFGRDPKNNEPGVYVYKLRKPVEEAIKSMEGKGVFTDMSNIVEYPKNVILYGPPGTGKTYHSVIYAVAIVEGKAIDDLKNEDYKSIKTRFDDYSNKGMIAFTTFHQSYGYEEFIEGIKPKAEGNNITYSVESGIFKKFCESDKTFDEAWNELIEAVPESGEYEFTRETGTKVVTTLEDDETFKVSWNGKYNTFNKLKKEKIRNQWLNPQDRNQLSGGTRWIYDANNAILNTLKEKFKLKDWNGKLDNKVFIIDEINRGNISKVFGELITLIEESKRGGQPEEQSAVLPYSGDKFVVPSNIHIIGTMNTADRSIAIMDTALRRRFHFVEMLPDETLLEDIDEIEGINVSQMLKKMNARIKLLLDREHMIGHSYFLPLKESPSIDTLATIFKNSIIPLLQEYFFDDYEKIRLVLADNQKGTNTEYMFIVRTETVANDLFGSTDEVEEVLYNYTINEEAFNKAEAYKGIY